MFVPMRKFVKIKDFLRKEGPDFSCTVMNFQILLFFILLPLNLLLKFVSLLVVQGLRKVLQAPKVVTPPSGEMEGHPSS